jgi:DNA-binding transcriptional ArsR family regulator
MRSDAPALLPIFRSRHQADLLSWLLLHPDTEYSITELARLLDVPLTTLHREAQRLIDADLLNARHQGRNRLVRANPDHRATAPLTRLLELTFGPQTVIAEEFALPGADHVLIFGSWADRYQGTPGPPPHDIDVLVIGNVHRADIYDAADRAQSRLGIQVNPVLRSSDEWAADDDPLIEQIKRSAHLTVHPPKGHAA